MHRLARAALVLDQITDATLGEPLPVGLARITLVGQHGLYPRRECLDDLRQLVDLGFVGWVHLHMPGVAVFAVDCRVAPVAEEGVFAFLDPARFTVGAVNESGLLAFTFDVLPRACSAGDDGGINDGPARALHLQASLLQLAVDERQQPRVEFGLDQAVAEAANGAGIGQLTGRGFETSEDHEVQAHAQGLLQLGIGQTVPLTQQHELEHAQRRIGLGTTGAADLALVQARQLPSNGAPVKQLVQLHARAELDQRARAHQKEAVHRSSPPGAIGAHRPRTRIRSATSYAAVLHRI